VAFSFGEYWIWMLGIPVSLGIIFLVYKRVSQITTLWFSPDQYARSRPQLKFGLRAVSFLLLFAGLLGPYWGVQERSVSSLGREIYFLLDVSASMNATDVAPSRLMRAKEEIESILPDLKGDRVGLILFTEYPYIQCPLTQDHRAFRLFLNMADTRQFKQTGTQFRSALAKAVERLNETRRIQPEVSQAVVLISDGEDFGDLYTSLIERMRTAGVSVFTVGIGSYEGAPVPFARDGESRSFIRHPDGSMVMSQLQDTELRNIARASGTRYLAIDGPKDNLRPLTHQIHRLVASPLDTRRIQVENNKYQAFLLASVMLLFFTLFLMPIRKE
jgi:Ca-activated chloride channel family protein